MAAGTTKGEWRIATPIEKQQALLIDIVLIALSFAFTIVLQPIAGGSLLIGTLSSTVLIAMLAILLFSLVECLRSREPDLPGISQAVRMQLY